jgi:hypothetical protein
MVEETIETLFCLFIGEQKWWNRDRNGCCFLEGHGHPNSDCLVHAVEACK